MQAPLGTVTTHLVHRREGALTHWSRDAVICDLPGSFDNEDLLRVQEFLPDMADLGFNAVLLRPATPRVDSGLPDLAEFVSDAHSQGLKVIVRAFLSEDEIELDPDDSPPKLPLKHDAESLAERASAILATGADGVDLGPINDELCSPDASAHYLAFTEAVQTQLAEVELAGDTTILTAAILSEPRESALRHLQEDWFHHLRDDSLVAAPWDAGEIQRRVRQAYSDRDPLGHTTAWRYSLPKWTSSPNARSSADFGWAKSEDSERRESAMMLYTLSLPGSIYVPFLHVGGGVKVTKGKDPGLKFSFMKNAKARRLASLAHTAIGIRTRTSMGASTLAFIDGLDWAGTDAAVHTVGNVLVVLNVGKKPTSVPAEYRPMISSRSLSSNEKGATVMEPDSCAWFHMESVTPTGPTAYR